MKQQHDGGDRGFTLIEMIFAVLIAGLLAAIAIPVTMTVLENSYDTQTRTEMTAIASAIQMFAADSGEFPAELGDLLVESETTPARWSGPYMFAGENLDGFTMELVDGWGEPYAYFADDSRPFFRFLRSAGPDRVMNAGSGDDLTVAVDLARQMRAATQRELRMLRSAIVAYNHVNLPDAPLPSDIDDMVMMLQTDDYLPAGDGLTTDAWGNEYIPGPEPVQEIYTGAEALGGGVSGDDDDDDDGGTGGGEPQLVTLCHTPAGNPSARHTVEVAASTVDEHLAHGDTLGPCCPVVIDFETEDDFMTPLVDGQDIAAPDEFGNLLTITCSGPNFGAAVFNTDIGGPNDPGRDSDLLVGLGNSLIAQENNTQTLQGVYDFPDDDAGGAYFTFDFATYIEASSITLIDVDDGGVGMGVHLFNANGEERYFEAPAGWTSDIAAEGDIGYGVLDLTTTDPQPGFRTSSWASETPNFDPRRVVRIEVTLPGSGALDNLAFCPGDEIERLESCGVDFWSVHASAWLATGHSSTDLISSVFSIPAYLHECSPGLDTATLGQAISFSDWSGECGKARKLIRQGVAALLNADHPEIDFTLAAEDVAAVVADALASCSSTTMDAVANDLEAHNVANDCPLR